jgi:RNA polymerase sigma-70 factor (ECF subfamily)
MRRYHERILRLCVSMLADPAEAEDAAQEVFLKAYRSLDRFRGDAAFSTWLYRIAANHCHDLLRKHPRGQTQSWEALLETAGRRLEQLLSAPPSAGLAAEQSDLVRRALAQLPPDYCIVLILREIEELSYQEMAQVLDCSLDAVKARLRRARAQFEQLLRHFLDRDNV